MRRIHIWHRLVSCTGAVDVYRTHCGRELARPSDPANTDPRYRVATDASSGEVPTCLDCMRALRDAHLRRAEVSSARANQLTQQMESERRRRARA